MEISTVAEMYETMSELLATNRYDPRVKLPKDEHGMTIVAPEPDDPDDE